MSPEACLRRIEFMQAQGITSWPPEAFDLQNDKGRFQAAEWIAKEIYGFWHDAPIGVSDNDGYCGWLGN